MSFPVFDFQGLRQKSTSCLEDVKASCIKGKIDAQCMINMCTIILRGRNKIKKFLAKKEAELKKAEIKAEKDEGEGRGEEAEGDQGDQQEEGE